MKKIEIKIKNIKKAGYELKSKFKSQDTYTFEQVEEICNEYDFSLDMKIWTFCIYLNEQSFNEYCVEINEERDYIEMRKYLFKKIKESEGARRNIKAELEEEERMDNLFHFSDFSDDFDFD